MTSFHIWLSGLKHKYFRSLLAIPHACQFLSFSFKCFIFTIYLCVCTCQCTCHGIWSRGHRTACWSGVSSYHTGSKDPNQVLKLGSNAFPLRAISWAPGQFLLLSRSGSKRAESLITSKSCGWFLQIHFERREPEEATVAEDSREVGVEGGEAGSVKLGHVQGMETSVSKVSVKPQSLMSRLV